MNALASNTQLAERLPFVMDENDQREAVGAIEDLSDEARHYGNPRWISPEATPYAVINLVLKAAARHMKNYEGYTSSRAGDEAVGWTDRGVEAGSATFTPAERDRLADLGGHQRNGFQSVNMFAFQRKTALRQEGLVPDATSSEPINFFSSDTEPW